ARRGAPGAAPQRSGPDGRRHAARVVAAPAPGPRRGRRGPDERRAELLRARDPDRLDEPVRVPSARAPRGRGAGVGPRERGARPGRAALRRGGWPRGRGPPRWPAGRRRRREGLRCRRRAAPRASEPAGSSGMGGWGAQRRGAALSAPEARHPEGSVPRMAPKLRVGLAAFSASLALDYFTKRLVVKHLLFTD